MQRTLFSCFISLLLFAACTVTTTAAPIAAGDAGDADAGADTDAGTLDAAKKPGTRVGDRCTGTCSTGQACVGISRSTGEATCLATCDAAHPCPGADRCRNGFCFPTCADGCPAAMTCIPDINECEFDCITNPSLCGRGEMCQMGVSCVKAVPDAGPKTCAPGGGAATSGLSGTKTVGALSGAEQATFCDWAAAVTGGYNCRSACDGGLTASFAASQADCIAKFTKPGCAATIAAAETCVKENAQDVCALKILTSPSCATLRACR